MQIQGQFLPPSTAVYESAAAEDNHQIKASPGILYGFMVTNFNAAARYIYVFDSAAGATGLPLIPPIPLTAAGTAGSIAAIFPGFALPFTAGIYVASSSTGPTFTDSGAADLRMTAFYK